MGENKPNRWPFAHIFRKRAIDWRKAWSKPAPSVSFAMTPLEAALLTRRNERAEAMRASIGRAESVS